MKSTTITVFSVFVLTLIVLNTQAVSAASPACLLPKKVGFCKAMFRRFYYDANRGGCFTFVYGGCGSNGNNFKTQQQCMNACGP
ncbi:PI-actitoxin-Afv2a-like [Littorina saxatilis]|uniref:BPTI/Kunitz inhibitor domain-containing protein n=1 Tax=Littorina saxatilis TaxID=31220 RepID=A0AAN9BLY8_9CAEN